MTSAVGIHFVVVLGRIFYSHSSHSRLLGLKRIKDKLAKTLGRKVKRENIRRINAKAIPPLDCGYDTDGCISLQCGVR